MDRTINTLFMLSSVDGKINFSATDDLDIDEEFPKIDGIKEGLQQYYDIEQTTDLFSFITAKTLAKIGINDHNETPPKTPVTFIVVDNAGHLTENGIRYLAAWRERLIIVTTDKEYKTYGYPVDVISYQDKIDLHDLFKRLKQDYGAENVTIQSGGMMNGLLLREKLIDYVNLVFAPVLVGGKDVPTLIDGESIRNESELNGLGILELLECKVLENSYINVRYKVVR